MTIKSISAWVIPNPGHGGKIGFFIITPGAIHGDKFYLFMDHPGTFAW
jgi:hypothetical protein